MKVLRRIASLLLVGALSFCWGQHVFLKPASRNVLPEIIDGNTAAYWRDGVLTIFHSSGVPTLSQGPDQFQLSPALPIHFDNDAHKPVWFEAVWQDSDGTLFLWYHHEPKVCDNGLTAPKIGAAISRDGGFTVEDLGIILESGDAPNCDAKNGFFTSGHGDMSAVFDEKSGYFYFFFTNYSGPIQQQGVVTARMRYADRFSPVGKVYKFFQGQWNEPGIHGATSAIFPARQGWEHQDTDSYWGPAVHWNTHLQKWVMLLNHACCYTGWPQTGIYVSFNGDLAAAGSWRNPLMILERNQLPGNNGFYPQILGLETGGTDTLGGRVNRLYVHGISDWEITFEPEGAPVEELLDDSLSPSLQISKRPRRLF